MVPRKPKTDGRKKGTGAATVPGKEDPVRIKTKKRIARALVALIVAATLVGIALVVNIQAETINIQDGLKTELEAGPRTGLYKRGGYWYYGHKTKSALYDVGDLTRDSFRIINGKYYYFLHDGKMLTHNTHYIKLNRDHSVKYIYTPGTRKKHRFNVELRLGQYKKHGRWITETGMQYDLYGQIDMQP